MKKVRILYCFKPVFLRFEVRILYFLGSIDDTNETFKAMVIKHLNKIFLIFWVIQRFGLL